MEEAPHGNPQLVQDGDAAPTGQMVVPCLCSTPEHKYVTELNGGEQPPEITVIDRDDLDAWMADAPSVDASVQRTASGEMERLARIYNMERAALLAGVTDVAARVRDLGNVVDAVDLDWAVDFSQREGATSVTIRPRDPDAPVRSPIGFSVEIGELSQHTELGQQIMRNIGYATSEPLKIPRDLVCSVRFEGPEFIAGEYPPGAVEIVTGPSGGVVGLPLELRAFQNDTLVASYEGASLIQRPARSACQSKPPSARASHCGAASRT